MESLEQHEIQKLKLRVEKLEKELNALGEMFLQFGLKFTPATDLTEAIYAENSAAEATPIIEEAKEQQAVSTVQTPVELPQKPQTETVTAFAEKAAVQAAPCLTAEQQKEPIAVTLSEEKPAELPEQQIDKLQQEKEKFMQKYIELNTNMEDEVDLDIKSECVRKLINYKQWQDVPTELLNEVVFEEGSSDSKYRACASQIDDGFYYFVVPCDAEDEKFTERERIRRALPLVFELEYSAKLQEKAFELEQPAIMKQCDDGTLKLHSKGKLLLAY